MANNNNYSKTNNSQRNGQNCFRNDDAQQRTEQKGMNNTQNRADNNAQNRTDNNAQNRMQNKNQSSAQNSAINRRSGENSGR